LGRSSETFFGVVFFVARGFFTTFGTYFLLLGFCCGVLFKSIPWYHWYQNPIREMVTTRQKSHKKNDRFQAKLASRPFQINNCDNERVLGLEVFPKTTTEQEFHKHTENRIVRGEGSYEFSQRGEREKMERGKTKKGTNKNQNGGRKRVL
jgi:hypothetical protein